MEIDTTLRLFVPNVARTGWSWSVWTPVSETENATFSGFGIIEKPLSR